MLYFAFRNTLYKASLAFKEVQSKFFARLYEQVKYIKQVKVNAIQPEINQRADDGFINYLGKTIHN